jgi:hypothetical protein
MSIMRWQGLRRRPQPGCWSRPFSCWQPERAPKGQTQKASLNPVGFGPVPATCSNQSFFNAAEEVFRVGLCLLGNPLITAVLE